MLLVALMVMVLQSMVLGVALGVVGRWLLLGVGPCHSWLRAWWVALLVSLPVYPSGISGIAAALQPPWRRVRGAIPRRHFVGFVVGVGGGFLAIPG